MKLIRQMFLVLLLAGTAPLYTAAQGPQRSHAQDFANCLDEFSACDNATLNAQERQTVRRVVQDRNFQNCFEGFPDCDRKLLNTEEQREVARENRDRNLR